MDKHTLYLRDLLLLSNLSEVLLANATTDFRAYLGKPDKEIHAYSEIVKVCYGNYELEVHRQDGRLLHAQNMHPSPVYPVNFQHYLCYENDSFRVGTEGFIEEEDISWASFEQVLLSKFGEFKYLEQSESKFSIALPNTLVCHFIGESVDWIYDEKGTKKDYKELHFEHKDDFILYGLSCNFY